MCIVDIFSKIKCIPGDEPQICDTDSWAYFTYVQLWETKDSNNILVILLIAYYELKRHICR